MRRPLLAAAAALVLGILAARSFVFLPYAVSALTASAALYVALSSKITTGRKASLLVFYSIGALICLLYGPGSPSRVDRLIGRGVVTVTGEVARPPEERHGNTLLFLRPDAPPGAGLLSYPPRAGLVRVNIRGTGLGIAYGDVLDAAVELRRPAGLKNPGTFDWGEYALSNGEDAVAYAPPSALSVAGSRAGFFLKSLYRLREELVRRSEASLAAHDSAIFRSMVLGDQGGVDEGMREAFAASGTTHLLSVSGSHVALLASLIFLVVNRIFFLLPYRAALRTSMWFDYKKAAAAITIPVAAAYCMLAGLEVATVRSLIMICAFLLALLIDREADVLNILAAATLIVLFMDPCALFDISFQLSYGSVLFMALVALSGPGTPSDGSGRVSGGRLPYWAGLALISSVAAIAGTAPLVARQFNSFSWVALPANLLAVPLAGYAVVPAGLLSALVYAVHPSNGLPLAWLNHHVISFFYRAVTLSASAPHANLHPAAPALPVMSAFYLAASSLLVWKAGLMKKGAAVACCTALLFGAGYVQPRHGGGMTVTFLDVGQGDCALVELPDGRSMLIDGGGNPRGVDPGRAAVAPYLWNRGIRRIDCVVISHPHPDHVAGLMYIFRNFGVGEVWEGGCVSDTKVYRELVALMAEKDVPRRVFAGRGEMAVGGAAVQVLSTAGDAPADDDGEPVYKQENNSSLVLRIKYGGVSFLFMGDAQYEEQEALIETEPALPFKSTVMKVPHHGGRSALDEAFVDAVSPKVAVISVGRPGGTRSFSEVGSALSALGARVYDTSDDGAVVAETDGKTVRVKTYADFKMRPAAGWDEELANIRMLL